MKSQYLPALTIGGGFGRPRSCSVTQEGQNESSGLRCPSASGVPRFYQSSGNPSPTFITSDVIAAISSLAHMDVKGTRCLIRGEAMTTLTHQEKK
jgi:hypothetical protein